MTDAAGLPADHRHRLLALDPRRSVCVTAPAGSGKTELLTQRVLRLLSCVDHPEEILAVTFTRKAAAEMHHRIMDALDAASRAQGSVPPHKQLSRELALQALDRNEQRGWRLLENPGRLKIQTIDSLCASLTRQMPVLSNFGAQPQVTDRAQGFYRLAIQQLSAKLERDDATGEALSQLMRHTDNDFSRLENLLTAMLERRDQWLLHLGAGGDLAAARNTLERTLQQIILETIRGISQALAPLGPELVPLLDYAGDNMRQSESPIADLAGATALPPVSLEALPRWRGVAELLLVKPPKLQFRQSLTKNCGFPTQTRDGDKTLAKRRKAQMLKLLVLMRENTSLLDRFGEFHHLPDPRYPQRQWQLLEVLLQLLPALAAELTLAFQQQGTVDHTQVALAALQGLGESTNPSELALILDHRLRHILIDEFQDTSTTQFRLLEKLVEGWAEHNQVHPQTPHTIFLVGDGMQSIYGFRNANVGLFLEAKTVGVNGVALEDLPLTVNFRSDPRLVEWNNRLFAGAFPGRENLSRGAVPYQPSTAFNAANDASDIAVSGFVGDGAEQREAGYIADLIVDLRERQPGDSIAVLVRNRSHLRELIKVLSARNISWNATDIDRLGNYGCIVDLLSLTRAMHNPADRVSWAALLRAPWFGLDNRDLHALLGRSEHRAIWPLLQQWPAVSSRLSPFARERLARQQPILQTAMENRQRQGFREWIEGLWISLGGPAGLSDPRELDMVESFFDMLEQHQTGGRIESLDDFEQAVQQLYAKPADRDSDLQLMTIHKSKGLEFDTVILPGLARSPRSDNPALLMWREYLSGDGSQSGLVISPLPAAGGEDATYRHLRYEQNLSQSIEDARLLYVAATRAVKRLYLTFCSDRDPGAEQSGPPRKGSLLGCVWEGLREQVDWRLPASEPPAQIGLAFNEGRARTTLKRLRVDWSEPDWSFPNPLADYYLDAEFQGDNEPAIAVDRVPESVGTVVHTVFETLHRRGIGAWQGMTGALQQRWVWRLLEDQGLNREQCDCGVVTVLQAVQNTLDDGRGRWLLGRGARVDFAELAVSCAVNGTVRHRVVDRVLYDEQGALWIVDYKTAQPLEGESRQQFVARESDLYRGQLQEYQWYVSRLIPHDGPIRLALYFTAIPLFHEI